MTIIEKISSGYPEMTRSEKAISAYLLSHRDEFETLSIKELAERNNVSTTTLIRYARKLGFEGFRDFKRAVCENTVVYPNLVSKFEHVAYLSSNKILSDTVNQAFSCIEETFSELDSASLDHAVSLLSGARRVYTFGMKESFALAHYAFTRLYTVRDDVFLLDVSGGDMEPILDIKKGDVCLVFLFHRYTKRSVEVLPLLKKTGATVILVTNEPYDSLSEDADAVLPCKVYGTGIKNTSIAPICLLDFFCNAIAAKDSEKSLERMKKIEELLEDQLQAGR